MHPNVGINCVKSKFYQNVYVYCVRSKLNPNDNVNSTIPTKAYSTKAYSTIGSSS